MGVRQVKIAVLVPDDSLLHFALNQHIFCPTKRVLFQLGLVPPSNDLFRPGRFEEAQKCQRTLGHSQVKDLLE